MTRRMWMAILIAVSGCMDPPMADPIPPGEPVPKPAPAPPPPAPPPPAPPVPEPEPSRIKVQHVLIAFKGAARAPAKVTRTREEAEVLAGEVLQRARKGEDIAKLADEFSTDAGGGRYTLVNSGVTPGAGDIKRADFIKPFTDVAFKLKVGEAGLVEYDATAAPFGWHIIKRLE